MIEFKNIKESAREAYKKDEFFEFLTGRNGYELRVVDVPVDVPTDWTRAIPLGIYALYEESMDIDVVDKYQRAITKAINNSTSDLWCAVNIIYFQMDHEMMKKTPFTIDRTIIKGLKEKIITSRSELEEKYPYGKNGWNMYEDILRLNHNFTSDWGFSFLD